MLYLGGAGGLFPFSPVGGFPGPRLILDGSSQPAMRHLVNGPSLSSGSSKTPIIPTAKFVVSPFSFNA